MMLINVEDVMRTIVSKWDRAQAAPRFITFAAAAIVIIVALIIRANEAPYIAIAENRFRDAKFDLLTKAEAGNGFASFLLGRGYEIGQLGKADNTAAAQWYLNAARQNDVYAIARYVNIAMTGAIAQPERCQSAMKLLDLAGRAHDPFALRRLGDYYATGFCVDRDMSTAVRYYKGAATIDGMLIGSATSRSTLSQLDSQQIRELPVLPDRFDTAPDIALRQFFAELAALSMR